MVKGTDPRIIATPPLYTLDEARREITRQECARFGHSWNIVETVGQGPIAITCNRCGKAHKVAPDA